MTRWDSGGGQGRSNRPRVDFQNPLIREQILLFFGEVLINHLLLIKKWKGLSYGGILVVLKIALLALWIDTFLYGIHFLPSHQDVPFI